MPPEGWTTVSMKTDVYADLITLQQMIDEDSVSRTLETAIYVTIAIAEIDRENSCKVL